MTRVLVLVAVVVAVTALAQDRTITVREIDVQPLAAEIDVLPDGGCLLSARVTVVPPSVEPQRVRVKYPFNGARCTTVKNAIVTAAKKDLECGDGALP